MVGRGRYAAGPWSFGLAAGLLLAALPSTRVHAQDPCAGLYGEAAAALGAGDLDAAETVWREATEAACPGKTSVLLGRDLALKRYGQALANLQRGEPAADQTPLLDRALETGRPWQVLAARGELALDSQDYAEAATLLQQALDDLADESLNPAEVPEPEIARIYTLAAEARLLSPSHVAVTRSRGKIAGTLQASIRGFTPKRSAVPVQFVYNSTEFTPKGQEAVQELAEFVRAGATGRLVLIGHTDERGDAGFNRALSLARAEAVRDVLVADGYRGEISVEGRGEDEPFQPDDPGRYDAEQRYQLDRRVEMARPPT